MTDENPLARILGSLGHDIDRCRMDGAATMLEIYEFLDSLTPRQLAAFRKIVNAPKLLEYFDGMAHTLLRRVHGVDPDTGRSVEDALVEIAGPGVAP
jgi:hypothetical protein